MHGSANLEYSTDRTTDIRWPKPDVAQVILGGEHDLSTADRLEQSLLDTLAACTKLIVDLRDTQFIDSSTIRVLLSAKRHADTDGRKFHLVLATTPIVESALRITRVLPFLNRVHTLEQALAEE